MLDSAALTYVLHYSQEPSDCLLPQASTLRLVNGLQDIPSYQRLYREIGGEWGWSRHGDWQPMQWAHHLQGPDVQGWIMYWADQANGFFELRRHPDESVEIYYFGVAKALQGLGIGQALIQHALTAAKAMTNHTVWLKTSSTDHPAALALYLRAGFKVVRVVPKDTSLNGADSCIPAGNS
ncbi:GNAT family N-acetyltransferase [Pseudomonas soli]|uniref:GNAT family N-acetyltransferase n=1 Tax=Pseudomonas soli TaxID=1306993 RepID=A0AAJ5MGT6_9PSED|nr:GNAT family N-acetyltransferase [Pseudomonas soli]MDW9404524.1 GNAT family N-acetyltransferase [Pseudomonas soli]PYC41762.1 N-acetyltransferase [Pseudomonas soli]UXZ43983.1 GNAT family N-acetyltransferase [Pseudomonas soli]